jgi:hypothetical protein
MFVKMNDHPKSFTCLYPPVCIFGQYTKRWYIIADGIWNEVSRRYDWEELKKMWIKSEQKTIPIAIKNEVIRYNVDGSKGNKYEIVQSGSFWTCSCPAHGFGRGRDCKHIVAIKNKIKTNA